MAKAIAAETGGEVMAAPWHAGDWDGAPDFVDRVVDRFGRIDILVNNEAIAPQFMSVADMTSDFWDKVMSVNLKGRSASPAWSLRAWANKAAVPSSTWPASAPTGAVTTTAPTR